MDSTEPWNFLYEIMKLISLKSDDDIVEANISKCFTHDGDLYLLITAQITVHDS